MRKIFGIVALVIFSVVFLAGCKGGTMIDKLMKAREKGLAVERPTVTNPNMGLEEAYVLQKQLVDRLIREKGEKVIGYKLSPKTVKDPSGGSELIPVYGYLFESMKVPAGETLKKSDFIDLHLENEVAFIIGKEINPEDIKTPTNLKKYVREVVPAIEMPEIRYKGSIDAVTGLDLVVDNVVASKIMLGPGTSPTGVDADLIEIKMTCDDKVVNEGVSTMVEGSPWNALFWLVGELGKKGETLKPGMIVMTGGIAKFMDSTPGVYEAMYDGLGTITFKIAER